MAKIVSSFNFVVYFDDTQLHNDFIEWEGEWNDEFNDGWNGVQQIEVEDAAIEIADKVCGKNKWNTIIFTEWDEATQRKKVDGASFITRHYEVMYS